MDNEIASRKSRARFAGLLYLIWIMTALYSMFYVSSKINMRGGAVITAQNILANEFLFRTSIVIDLIGSTLWVFMALVFYRLFKSVNERQAKLMVALVIVQIPAGFVVEAFHITSLMILKGEVLKTFELSQRQELAMLFLKINDYIVSTVVLFWGLWLFPLVTLVYRSHFLPRFLGVWLIINGFAYLVLSFTGLLLPLYKGMLFKIGLPAMFGEVAFMLWLLIKGATLGSVSSEQSTPVASTIS
jgi:hypothetical protein